MVVFVFEQSTNINIYRLFQDVNNAHPQLQYQKDDLAISQPLLISVHKSNTPRTKFLSKTCIFFFYFFAKFPQYYRVLEVKDSLAELKPQHLQRKACHKTTGADSTLLHS